MSRFSVMSPVSTEGFLHWLRGKGVLTLNVETETFTFTRIPLPHQFSPRALLSTGTDLTVFRRCSEDLLWENRVMESKSGEWRNMAPLNIDLRPLECLILQHYFSSRLGDLFEPLGWVKFPEVLAFHFFG